MRKKLLCLGLVTMMVASSVLTGCGKEENKGNTASGNVQNSQAAQTGSASSAVEYDEKYTVEEPDWDEVYAKELEVFKNDEEVAAFYTNEKKMKYDVTKFVFEDLTQKFKNKESITTDKGIVECDVVKFIPDDKITEENVEYVYDRKSYTEFIGFDMESAEGYVNREPNSKEFDTLQVVIDTKRKKGMLECPLTISAYLTVDEDGSYRYKERESVYRLYDIE